MWCTKRCKLERVGLYCHGHGDVLKFNNSSDRLCTDTQPEPVIIQKTPYQQKNISHFEKCQNFFFFFFFLFCSAEDLYKDFNEPPHFNSLCHKNAWSETQLQRSLYIFSFCLSIFAFSSPFLLSPSLPLSHTHTHTHTFTLFSLSLGLDELHLKLRQVKVKSWVNCEA